MKKWANELNRGFQKKKSKCQKKKKKEKTHEEMLNIPSHKGNANQNHIKIPPHYC
jgi:hypothetical protein